MITKLYMHTHGSNLGDPFPVDRPWLNSLRSHIFCQNQEEHDYLSSLNLMHGREIEINIWDEWLSIRRELQINKCSFPRVLPIAYTTWPANLRGY